MPWTDSEDNCVVSEDHLVRISCPFGNLSWVVSEVLGAVCPVGDQMGCQQLALDNLPSVVSQDQRVVMM